MATLSTFGGMRIIVNNYMTYRARRIAIRTRRERWLSWPFRPWVKRKVIVVDAPSHMFYLMKHENALVCHPSRARWLMGRLDKEVEG